MSESQEQARTLTRQDLRAAIYESCPGISREEAQKFLDMAIEEVADALARGESVSLRGFGAFNLRAKRERIGRNPKTGVEAVIRARKVVTFHPSPTLVARVNTPPGE